jgi:hypothetical protein
MDKRIEEWSRLDFEWAANQIHKIEPDDPQAEEKANAILLANAHPALVDAFNSLDHLRQVKA